MGASAVGAEGPLRLAFQTCRVPSTPRCQAHVDLTLHHSDVRGQELFHPSFQKRNLRPRRASNFPTLQPRGSPRKPGGWWVAPSRGGEGPCFNSGFQECKRGAETSCPCFLEKEGKEPGPESPVSGPDGWAPTFLELDLKGVRDVGGFGWVLGLCVEAWRRLVLTKDRKRLEARLLRTEQSQDTPHPTSC